MLQRSVCLRQTKVFYLSGRGDRNERRWPLLRRPQVWDGSHSRSPATDNSASYGQQVCRAAASSSPSPITVRLTLRQTGVFLWRTCFFFSQVYVDLWNQRLFWLKSTWHKKTAAFLMSVVNRRCQLVLTPRRQILGHTGPGYIKISHQQHSSRGGRT